MSDCVAKFYAQFSHLSRFRFLVHHFEGRGVVAIWVQRQCVASCSLIHEMTEEAALQQQPSFTQNITFVETELKSFGTHGRPHQMAAGRERQKQRFVTYGFGESESLEKGRRCSTLQPLILHSRTYGHGRGRT